MASPPFSRRDRNDPRPHAIETTDSRRPTPPFATPFACQHGTTLLLLEAGPVSWTLAELRFDDYACSYGEVRRSHYAWPREAAGALLGRLVAADPPQLQETAERLARWAADAEASAR